MLLWKMAMMFAMILSLFECFDCLLKREADVCSSLETVHLLLLFSKLNFDSSGFALGQIPKHGNSKSGHHQKNDFRLFSSLRNSDRAEPPNIDFRF